MRGIILPGAMSDRCFRFVYVSLLWIFVALVPQVVVSWSCHRAADDRDVGVATVFSSVIVKARLQYGLTSPALAFDVLKVYKGPNSIKGFVQGDQTEYMPCLSNDSLYLIFINNSFSDHDFTIDNSANSRSRLTVHKNWIVPWTQSVEKHLKKHVCVKNCRKPSVILKGKERRAEVGERIRVTCRTLGRPPPLVFWTKNHLPLNFSSHVAVSTKRHRSVLLIEHAGLDDTSTYRCYAVNDIGKSRYARVRIVVERNITKCPHITTPCSSLEDSTYCLHGGICCQHAAFQGKFCACPPSYTGMTCEYYENNLILPVKDPDHKNVRFDGSLVVIIIVITILLAMPIVILVFVVTSRLCHRQQKPKGVNIPQVVSQLAPYHQEYCYNRTSLLMDADHWQLPQHDTPVDEIHEYQMATTSSHVKEEHPTDDVDRSSSGHMVESNFSMDTDTCQSDTKYDLKQDHDHFQTYASSYSNNEAEYAVDIGSVTSDGFDKCELVSDVEAHCASDADFLDDDDTADHYLSQNSQPPSCSGVSFGDSLYVGDTTSWTQDEGDSVASYSNELLRQLHEYMPGSDASLDQFTAGGILPSLNEFIGNREDLWRQNNELNDSSSDEHADEPF